MRIIRTAYAQTNIETPQLTSFFKIKNLGQIIRQTIEVSMIVAALLMLGYLLWGGLDWIMSGGDKAKYESARGKITHAIIGLGLTALVWVTWTITLNFLGIGEASPDSGVNIILSNP